MLMPWIKISQNWYCLFLFKKTGNLESSYLASVLNLNFELGIKSKFIQYNYKYSTVESNINELENKGLDRCPNKVYPKLKRYIAIGICAYNLHKIGTKIMQIKIATKNEQRRAS